MDSPPFFVPTDDLRVQPELSATALVHVLRTPLTTVHGFLETLVHHGDELEPALRHEMLTTAYRNSALLAQRVSEIIELQRIYAGSVLLAPIQCDLAEQLHQFLRDREGMLSAHEIMLDVDEGVGVVADVDGLRHAMANIVSDAVQHTRPRSTISIIALTQDDRALVLVSDGGEPIDPDDLPHVFDPTYRGDGRRRGCGVGLAIAHQYITLMGGEIFCRSEPGHGTTVWFSLPLADPRPEHPILLADDADGGAQGV